MACEVCLPIGLDHKVEVNKVVEAAVQRGKGGHCILTTRTDCGPGGTASVIDASNPIVTYVSKADMAAEWDSTCPAYQQACQSFDRKNGNTPGNGEVSIVFIDEALPVNEAIDAVYECMGGCYSVTTPDWKDDPRQADVAAYFNQDVLHQYIALTCNPDPKDSASINGIVNDNMFDTMVVYQDATHTGWLDAWAAGFIASQTFDAPVVGGYTMFNQQVSGLPASDLTASQLAEFEECNLNAVVCQGGFNLFKFGLLGNGLRADACHKACWFKQRLEEAQFNKQIAGNTQIYDEEGYYAVIDCWSAVFRDAQDRRIITGGRFNVKDDQERGYSIDAPAFSEIAAANFSDRTTPCISSVSFDSGAIERTCFSFQLTQ